MLKIKEFVFNPFQVNTYLLYDETGECAIIDAACYSESEKSSLKDFIDFNKLKPVKLINTHCHIDHVLGNNYVAQVWGLKPVIHAEGEIILQKTVEYGGMFGFEVDEPVMPEEYVAENEVISFGHQQLKVLHTPGHAAGSICLYHEQEAKVWVGDVLFHNSIGRTDLPTGNFNLLLDSINNKLFTLPDDTKVYCGHGSTTTIGIEKKHNPFLMGH